MEKGTTVTRRVGQFASDFLKEKYEQGNSFNRYQEKMTIQPHFTQIPKQYFIDNPILGTDDYIKKKMKLPLDHAITFKDKLDACIKFPEICAKIMLGIQLRPYQHYDLDLCYRERYVVKSWSRRLGKTTDNRIMLLHTGRFNLLPSQSGGTTWNVVLQDQDIANDLYIEPLHEMMEKADKITADTFRKKDGTSVLGENFWTKCLLTPRDKVGKVRVNKISFRIVNIPGSNIKPGICRITTFAPTKKVIGREGNLMGDEVSKWKDNPKCKDEFKFYDQLIAILKDNPIYKGIFASTPEGEEDVFATEMFDPNDNNESNNYHKSWFAYWVRDDEHWIKEITKTEEQSIKNRRHHTFLQEYEASFLTITNPFFHPDDVQQTVTDNWRKNYSTIPCSLGLDWGGTEKSETAWYITEWDLKHNSPRKVVAFKSYPVGQDLTHLKPDLQTIKRNFNIKWVTPDNKGGRWMMPELEKLFGLGRVKPLNFTTDKRAGYEKLRQAMSDKMIQIPNSTKLLKQITGLSEELKPASSKGKDDEIDALMMSLYPIYDQEPKTYKVWNY